MIRNSKTQDWNSIKSIYIDGMNTNNATFEQPKDLIDYDHWISKKIKSACFVAEIENKVVGWSSLSPVSSRCVYAGVAEVSIYVDPSKSGQGIGGKLMNALINYSEKNNIWTLQAGIFPENTPSILLHKKCGFRNVGYREKIGKLHNEWRDNLLFERRSKKII